MTAVIKPDGKSLSKAVEPMKVLVGEFLLMFGQLEQVVRNRIAVHFGPNEIDFNILTENIDVLQLISGFTKLSDDKKTKELFKEFQAINTERRELVHGFYIPLVEPDPQGVEGAFTVRHTLRYSTREAHKPISKDIDLEHIKNLNDKVWKLKNKISENTPGEGFLSSLKFEPEVKR